MPSLHSASSVRECVCLCVRALVCVCICVSVFGLPFEADEGQGQDGADDGDVLQIVDGLTEELSEDPREREPLSKLQQQKCI